MGEVVHWDEVPAAPRTRFASLRQSELENDAAQAIASGLPVRCSKSVGNRNYKTKYRIRSIVKDCGCDVSFAPMIESAWPISATTGRPQPRDLIYIYPQGSMPEIPNYDDGMADDE